MGRNLEFRYADRQRLIAELVRDVAFRLQQAVAERGRALLAVSGGRSPIPLFHALRDIDLPWTEITITLVDERCLPAEHPDSNAHLVRQHLLVGPAAAAHFVPFFEQIYDSDEQSLEGLCAAANERLAELAWPLDVAILGLGADGHSASLFAGSPGFEEAIDLEREAPCSLVYPAHVPYPRLTLTLRTLLAARHRLLQFGGADKIAVYERAQMGADPCLPISLLLHHAQGGVHAWIEA